MTKTPCACIRVRRAARAVTDLYDRALEGTGLKVTQFSVLRTIGRMEGASISEVADELALDRSTLGRNLIPLTRRGLVRLSGGADLRQRTVALTPRARKLVEACLPAWEAAQATVNESIGQRGVRQLFRLLEKLEERASRS
jgi:DNA-binding MarR family transcriptional regulator